METKRTQRVGEFIKHELARIFQTRVKDPHIQLLTITQVSVTPDLSLARVYVNVMGGEKKRADALAALERANAFIRHEVGQVLKTRIVPEFRFIYDDTLDYADSIEKLFRQIHEEDNPKSE